MARIIHRFFKEGPIRVGALKRQAALPQHAPSSPAQGAHLPPKGQLVDAKPFVAKKYSARSPKKPDDPYLHSIRIKQMALKGDLEAAIEYFEKRLDGKRIPYTTAVFNTVIDALGHAGRYRHAQDIYLEMKRRAVPPDVLTYCSLLNALSNCADPLDSPLERACQHYEEACSKRLCSTALFNNLLKVVCKAGSLDDALKVFPLDLQQPAPDNISYTILLGKMRGSRVAVWRPYFDRLIKDSISIDGPLMVFLLSCIRSSLESEAFDPDPFLSTFARKRELKDYHQAVIPAHFLYLDVLRKVKQYHRAVAHYDAAIRDNLNSRNQDDKVLSLVLRLLAQINDPKRVLSEFEHYRRALYYRPSPSSIQSIVEACKQTGSGKCAISYLTGYVLSGKVPLSAGILLAALKMAGECVLVREFVESKLLPQGVENSKCLIMQLNDPDAFDVVIVGAGPAGLAILCELLHQRPTLRIAWIDPEFGAGRLPSYASVPSNTKVGLFIQYLHFVKRVLPADAGADDLNGAEMFQGLHEDEHCALSLVANMVSTLVHQVQPLVRCVKASVTTLVAASPFLVETDAGHRLQATAVVLATGSHPKTFCDTACNVIPLETALDPDRLQEHLSATQNGTRPVYVFGASHSAVLVLRNLAALGVHAICVYKHPPKYAVYQAHDPQIIYDNTGLKGVAAQWAHCHWDALEKVHLVDNHLDIIDHGGHQVVQAIGFERNESLQVVVHGGRTVRLGELKRGDGGRLSAGDCVVPRLYGAGIAFPGIDVYEHQGAVIREESVGLFKFCRHSVKDVPVILADLDQHVHPPE